MKSLINTSLLLLALLLPATVAAYDFEVDGIYYNINGNEATVTNGPSYYSGDVTIPEAVTYNRVTRTVTAIDNKAFWLCSELTSVTIPNTVRSLGEYAFFSCSGLTSVTIPHSVTSICYNSFQSCMGLKSIKVENGNQSYDSRDNCNAIIETASNTLVAGCQNTIIPNSVTSIGETAFFKCIGLKAITIPNSVTSIGDAAFECCDSLMSLVIGSSVTSIGDDAFTYCYSMESISIDSDNPSYDSRGNCNAIIESASNTLIFGCKNTIIPNSVTSIGDWSFAVCSGLTSVNIPNSVTVIGNYAFEGCGGLRDVYSFITDLNNVTVGNNAFWLVSDSWDPNAYSVRTLHVLQGMADAYQADWHWYHYFGQIVDDLMPENHLHGDVNGDGEVNIADVNAVIDIILGGNGNTAADVNGDGEINITDINAILHIIMGGGGPSPDEHEWVDLGLPSGTLWATCNVGASNPEEYGDYFAWGETEPKDYYDWNTYKWSKDSSDTLTKYCT